MSTPLVEVKNLVKTFSSSNGFLSKKKNEHAINDVSFSINPKETFVLVGESGCGKSTMGRLILRLLKPDSGEIWFDGKNITDYSDNMMRPLRSDMQMIFQDPYGSLNPRMKVQNLIGEPLLLHTKLSPQERLKTVYSLMEEVGIHPQLANRYPHEFSADRHSPRTDGTSETDCGRRAGLGA